MAGVFSDGKQFLLMEWAYPQSAGTNNAVWAASLDGKRPSRMPLTATNVQYAAGHLLFSGHGDLLAQRFDVSRLELTGAPLPLARRIEYDTFFHNAAFTVSDTGILVYATEGTGVNSESTWVDRNGQEPGSPWGTWCIPGGKQSHRMPRRLPSASRMSPWAIGSGSMMLAEAHACRFPQMRVDLLTARSGRRTENGFRTGERLVRFRP